MKPQTSKLTIAILVFLGVIFVLTLAEGIA